MRHGDLSKRVRYLKREKGGYERMSAEAEELYNLGVEDGIEKGIAQSEKNQAKEKEATVIRMLKDKMPVEKIAIYQNMPVEEIHKIEERVIINE